MNNIDFIYSKLKDKYNLTLTNTLSLDEGFTIDVPVICGSSCIGRFWLYKEDDELFVFSIEYAGKVGNDRYTHGHPYDSESATKYIEDFMTGKNVFGN